MGVKDKSQKYIKFVIYFVAVVLINLAGITLFFRADLTANKIYTLSEASKQVVSTLSEPLTVKVFFTKNLPAPHNNTERYLHDLLEEYAIFSKRYFNYMFYDVNPNEGDIDAKTWKNQEMAENYGIRPIQIQNIESDEVKFQKAYMGLAIIHGDMIEQIPAITSVDGLEYALTMAIQKLNNKISALLTLEDNIQVKLFYSDSLKYVAPYMGIEELPELPGKLKEVVTGLNDKSYGKIDFEHLDPTIDELEDDSFAAYDIMTLKWPDLSDGAIKAGEGVIGLVMQYNENVVSIPLIRTMSIPLIGTQYQMAELNELEELISDNMELIIDINEDIGYLVGHGTLNLFSMPGMGGMPQMGMDDASNFRTVLSQNYSIKDVNIADKNIPDNFKSLIIAGPKQPFTDYELFQIDQFLMKGKNLILFADSLTEAAQQQQFGGPGQGICVPLNTGLEKLLKHYGVRMNQSYVMDENCYKQNMGSMMGGGERPIFFAPIIKNENINKDFQFMKNIKGLVLMKASPLELIEDRINDNKLKAHKLISSSDKSWEMAERINLNPMFHRPPADEAEYQDYALAYLIEGEFPSYFAGKPVPEKEVIDDKSELLENPEDTDKDPEEGDGSNDLSKIESMGQIKEKGAPGKIFIIASSEVLKNNMMDAEGRSTNAMFVLNVIDYMNNKEKIAVMRSKEQQFNPLHETSAGVKTFIKSFNIAGLPVLVVIFGMIVWLRRHSRKNHIKMMFQK